MRVRIGIDGFDRLGRRLLRTVVDRADPDFQVVAVRDDDPAEALAERLRHDSTHGGWSRQVEVVDEHLGVNGHSVRVLHDEHPHWVAADVEVVVVGPDAEPDGLLARGVRAVVLTMPGDADATVVVGLNDGDYDPIRHRVVTLPSAAATATALLLRPLDDAFGVVSAAATSIEGRTSQVAAPTDPHLLRDAAVNIIPSACDLGAEVAALLPGVEAQVGASALRVPVVDTALLELTVRVPAPVTVGQVRRVLRTAADGQAKGLLTTTTETTVSRDVLGAPESCRADLGALRVSGELVTVFGWYDPEIAQAHRTADLLGLVSRLLPRA